MIKNANTEQATNKTKTECITRSQKEQLSVKI